MNLNEIKEAVRAGKTVNWYSRGYEVRATGDQFLVMFVATGDCVGLTHQDGETLNGHPAEFFVAGEVPALRPHEGSWMAVEIGQSAPVKEIWRDSALLPHLNMEKYRLIPIGEYLAYQNMETKSCLR